MKDMKNQNFRKFQGECQELEREVKHLFKITLHDDKEYGTFIQQFLLTLEEVSCVVDLLDGSEEMFITYASISSNEEINNVFSSLNFKFENFRCKVPVEKIGKFIEVLLRNFGWFDCTIIARDINIIVSHDKFILVKPTAVTEDWVKKGLHNIISPR
jgi:hypothetical protein